MKIIKSIVTYMIIALVLCGCTDDSPSPEKFTNVEKKSGDTYVEKAINGWPQNVFDESKMMQFFCPQTDLEGNIFEFAQEYDETSKDKLNLYRVELKDNEWVEVKIPWKDKLNKKIRSKNVVIEKYCYTNDGILYLSLKEYSMYPNTYYRNIEKYKSEFYLVDEYLFQIDETNETVERVNLPKLYQKDYFAKEQQDNIPSDPEPLIPNTAIVLKNGNIFLSSLDLSMCGLYNGKTYEKMTEGVDISETIRCTVFEAGDDFFVLGVVNQNTNDIEIHVCAQDGQLQYTIPTDIVFDKEKFVSGDGNQIILGVDENEIMLATEKGIYSAEFGEKQFKMVVDVKSDRTYYLSPDYLFWSDSSILKGTNDDYYLMIKKNEQYEMDKAFLCHYVKE